MSKKSLCTYTSTTQNQFGTWDRACTKKAAHGGDHLVVSTKRLQAAPAKRTAADQCQNCHKFMTKARIEAGFTTHAACNTSATALVVEHVTPKETRMTTSTLSLKSLSARIDSQDVKLDAILAAVGGKAATSTPVAEKAAPKASTKKATPKAAKAKAAPKAHKGTPITMQTRVEFVKVAPWAKGLSTKDICTAIFEGRQTAPEGWHVPARRVAKLSA